MTPKMILLVTALLLPLSVAALPGDQEYALPADHHVERLGKDLQLSDEQKAKLEVIFNEQHEKFRAIHEQSHARLKEILSVEQMSKWEELKKQRQEKHRKMDHQRPEAKP